MEAAARKARVVPSKQVLKVRRLKAATESSSGAAKAAGRRGSSFASRIVLPAKMPSSVTSWPTTGRLALSGKAAAEKKVDEIVGEVLARVARED